MPRLYAVIGDSNAIGGGNLTQLVAPSSALAVDYPCVKRAAMFAQAAGFVDFPLAALGPHHPVDNPNGNIHFYGPEITLGRGLAYRLGCDEIVIAMYAKSGTSLDEHWKPDGGLHYADAIDYFKSIRAATGSVYGGAVVVIGTGDAGTSGKANAFAANMRALIAGMRAELDPSLRVVFHALHPDTQERAFVAPVIAAQIEVAADADNTALVPVADLAMRDSFHLKSDAILDVGWRDADALEGAVAFSASLAAVDEYVGDLQAVEEFSATLAPVEEYVGTLEDA